MNISPVLAAEEPGIFYLLLAVVVMCLAVCWVIFPFIVIVKFNRLIREVIALRTGITAIAGRNEETTPRKMQLPAVPPVSGARRSEAAPEPDVYRID